MAIKLTESEKLLIEEGAAEAVSKEKVLEVKNLIISFKTDNGKVQAVRGVSFDLHRGETLCIVGESGSGKSVTSKAIMGILAANAIVEGGQILYQGEDLLQVSEDEFHRIRGREIGMIFQDPLSSLNPIVKIGKQIIETMMINSNQLKNRYKDEIANELTDYKNAKVARDFAIKQAQNAYDDVCHESKKLLKEAFAKIKEADDASKEQAKADYEALKQERAKAEEEAKAQLQKVTEEAKAKYEAEAPALREALAKKKVEAKAEVKSYHEAAKKERDEKLAALQAKLDALTYTPEEAEAITKAKQDLAKAKRKYGFYAYSLYFLRKKKQKIALEGDKIIDELELKYRELDAKRLAILAEMANVRDEYNQKVKITKSMAKKRALEVMAEVGIPQPEKRFYQYPFQFSGGMRQRIVIAIALTAAPHILICDEPTTALDVTIQAQILELINKLKAQRHLSCIFITHDLGVVANMADRVAVMYAGKICEYGTDKEIFFDPRHPYTWALLSSIPDIDSKEKLEAIPGTPPDMIYPPVGDAFAARNKYALAIDFKYQPPLFEITPTHYAATWLEMEGAPEVEMPAIVVTRIKTALHDEEELRKHEKE